MVAPESGTVTLCQHSVNKCCLNPVQFTETPAIAVRILTTR